jgi:hypothetical protein
MFAKTPFDPRSVQYDAHSRFDNIPTPDGDSLSGYARMGRSQLRGLSHIVQRRVLLPARQLQITIPKFTPEAPTKPLDTVTQSAIGPQKENDAETLMVRGGVSEIDVPVPPIVQQRRQKKKKKHVRKAASRKNFAFHKVGGGRGGPIKGVKRRRPTTTFSSSFIPPNPEQPKIKQRKRVDTFGTY